MSKIKSDFSLDEYLQNRFNEASPRCVRQRGCSVALPQPPKPTRMCLSPPGALSPRARPLPPHANQRCPAETLGEGLGWEITPTWTTQAKKEIFLKDEATLPAAEEQDCRDAGNDSGNSPVLRLLGLQQLDPLLPVGRLFPWPRRRSSTAAMAPAPGSCPGSSVCFPFLAEETGEGEDFNHARQPAAFPKAQPRMLSQRSGWNHLSRTRNGDNLPHRKLRDP